MKIEVVGFDGDDTLWHNETIFTMTQGRFEDLLREHVDPRDLHERMLATERENVAIFGYGIKGFTLSMVETALEITDGRVTADELRSIIEFGKDMLRHPTELLEGARAAVEATARDRRVVLVTKGDLFDQESKLARSGLGELFDDVAIVSEKDEERYRRLLRDLAVTPESFLMVGNSMRSDVLPVVGIGARAVHVPYHVTWALEEVDEREVPATGWWRIDHLSELPGVLSSAGA